jgi:hypothetical protein
MNLSFLFFFNKSCKALVFPIFPKEDRHDAQGYVGRHDDPSIETVFGTASYISKFIYSLIVK